MSPEKVVEALAWSARVEKGRQRRLKLRWLSEDMERFFFENHPYLSMCLLGLNLLVADVVINGIHF